MMRQYIFVPILIVLMAATSCRNVERELYSPSDIHAYTADTYVDQFKIVWGGLSETYVFWPWTKADWDSVYNAHHDAFKEQDNSGQRMSEAEFHDRWSTIIGVLADHHMVASIRNPYSDSLHVFDLADMHLRLREGYHAALTSEELRLAQEEDIATARYTADQLTTDSTSWTMRINGTTGYVRVSEYCSPAVLEAAGNLLSAEETTTLIVDVRSSAGNDAWIEGLISLLPHERTAYAAHRTKFSSSPLDLTQPTMSYLAASTKASAVKRIICLTDMHTRDAAERMVMALRSLNTCGYIVQQIGETSMGAMGIAYPANDSKFNTFYAGSFGDKNIQGNRKSTYFIYGTAMTTQYPESLECPEGIGLTPDKVCPSEDALLMAL